MANMYISHTILETLKILTECQIYLWIVFIATVSRKILVLLRTFCSFWIHTVCLLYSLIQTGWVSVFLLLAGVQSAAVNVICELARKNPKNYLSLAPLFFKLMTSSTNNWMLIKIIKLVWLLHLNARTCIVSTKYALIANLKLLIWVFYAIDTMQKVSVCMK